MCKRRPCKKSFCYSFSQVLNTFFDDSIPSKVESISIFRDTINIDRDGEEVLNELYGDVFSNCPSDFEIFYSDVEDDSLSEDSDESDIRPSKRQKRNVTSSDSESDLEEE